VKRQKNSKAYRGAQKEFFDGSDQNTLSTGWCSAWLVFVGAIVLFLIASAVIWVLVKPHASSVSNLSKQASSPSAVSSSLKTSDVYTVFLNDSQLSEIVRQLQLSKVKNTSVQIHPGQVEIRGETDTGVVLPVMIAFVPKIDASGKLSIEVRDVTVGGVRAIPFVTDEIRTKLGEAITAYVANVLHGSITSIELKEGHLIAYLKTS